MKLTEVQEKHRKEREAVLADVLHDSLSHLQKADNRFVEAIGDNELRSQFSTGISNAREVLHELGIENPRD